MKPISTSLAPLFLSAAFASVPMVFASPPLDYNRDVRPILSDRCFACHGPDAAHREADLRFDDEASAKEDRGGYAAIVAGKPDESVMLQRIVSEDESERMPPPDSGKALSPAEIDTLRRWIAQGAPWSKHWAYEPPRHSSTPAVKDASWPANFVDAFLLSRMEAEGLKPSPETDRVTLARRLSFDLTGLPPAPEAVEAFERDDAPGAVERLVDGLLASPAFGERMAIFWLDLVRYADTVGYHGDQGHHASPYRDWVIDAFNENLPFDRFTRDQLAGDLAPNSDADAKIASAYNRLLQTSHEGGVQEKEYLAIYAADRVRNISLAWMGATVGCAQCHDHKFDPYSAKDFYALAAFFADLDEVQHLKRGADVTPTIRAPEVALLTRLERLQIASLERDIARGKQRLETSSFCDATEEAALRRSIAVAEQRRQALEDSARKVMISVAIEPRVMRVLPRGNWLDDTGPIVQPAIPEFLGRLETDGKRATRLDLAHWLTDEREGAGLLTARVFVNRLWALFFGRGLSRSLDDFGGQGEPPSHPELLDRLAVEFVESGWDMKHLVRLLTTSRAYRQTSLSSPELLRIDPENRLWARQGRWRLPAEMVRDNALQASGLLNREMGGASIRPYQPEGYYRHLNFPKRTYQHDTDPQQWRRGVYVHWQRTYLHPMLKAFDAPSREECTAERAKSNTPLASLVLLNDPTFVEAARVLAARTLREVNGDDDRRLDFVVRRVLSRAPDAVERAALRELLDAERKTFQSDPGAARQLLAVGLAPAPEDLDAVQAAAWTSVVRAVLNLNETTTRN